MKESTPAKGMLVELFSFSTTIHLLISSSHSYLPIFGLTIIYFVFLMLQPIIFMVISYILIVIMIY